MGGRGRWEEVGDGRKRQVGGNGGWEEVGDVRKWWMGDGRKRQVGGTQLFNFPLTLSTFLLGKLLKSNFLCSNI